MRLKSGRVSLLLITFLTISLLTAGCGSIAEKASEKATEKAIEQAAGGNAKVDLDGKGNVEIKTDKGTFKTGSNEWPEQIPADVPRFTEGEIVSVVEGSSEGEGKGILVAIENASMETVENYKSDLEKSGWKISMSSNTPDSIMYSAEKNNGVVTVSFTISEGKSASGGITYSEK